MKSNVNPSKPSAGNYKVAFDEYKMLFDWTNKIADRRQTTSNLFLSVDGALITVIGFALTQLTGSEKVLFLSFFSIIGISVSYIWLSLLKKYQQLLKFKYAQLIMFEETLGLDSSGLVLAEDLFFTKGVDLKIPGKNYGLVSPKKATGFGITILEQSLAQVFIVVFILIFVLVFFL